jgi:serine/threonine protein kinase
MADRNRLSAKRGPTPLLNPANIARNPANRIPFPIRTLAFTYFVSLIPSGYDKHTYTANKVNTSTNEKKKVLLYKLVKDSEHAKMYLATEAPFIRFIKNSPDHPLAKYVQTPSAMINHDDENGVACVWLVFEHLPPGFKDIKSIYMGQNVCEDLTKSIFKQIVDFTIICHENGYSIGTIKLESTFIDDTGKIHILFFPRILRVAHPSKKNSHKTVGLPMNARIAFGNDVIIIGYILGFLLTGAKPKIHSTRKLHGTVWTRVNNIVFPIDSLRNEIKSLIKSCLTFLPSERCTIGQIADHPFVSV